MKNPSTSSLLKLRRCLLVLALFLTPVLAVPFSRAVAASGQPSAIQKADVVPNTAFSVTTLDDSGPGSLRQAIIDANADPGTPHTITFGVTGTINLLSILPTITRSMTISGPGVNQITISGNQTFQLFVIDIGATLDISNVTVRAGFAPNTAFGGAFQVAGGLNVNGCVISDNTSPSISGSAIGNIFGTVTVRNSLFTGNRGVLLAHGGSMTVENTTFANNQVFSMYFFPDAAPASATFRNVTMANVSGSGVFFDGRFLAMTFTTQNSIYQNGGANFQFAVTQPTFNTLGGNINDDTTFAGSFNGTGDRVNTNSLLSALGDYGGPTQTVALLPGSPAIDNGVAAGAPATDQRGIARPQLTGIDSGAFESRGFTLSVNGGGTQSAPVSTAFATALTVGVVPNAVGEPVDGGRVSFTVPASGAGCSLSTNPGTIATGTATPGTTTANTTTGGPYTVTASARGGNSVDFSLTNICRTISLTPNGGALAGGTIGQSYNQSVSASGGLTPYGYAVTGGSLPTGLSLSSAGAVTGIPTAPGTFNFTVTATDASGCTQGGNYAITIPGTQTPVNVNSRVSLTITNQTLTPATCPGDANDFVITATLTNTSADPLLDPYFQVVELAESGGAPPATPFRLLSANGAGCGTGGLVGSQQTVGAPGFTLFPGQSVPVTFRIGLPQVRRFRFFVSVFAVLPAPPGRGAATRTSRSLEMTFDLPPSGAIRPEASIALNRGSGSFQIKSVELHSRTCPVR